MIREIMDTWFSGWKYKQLYPACTECPFCQASPYSGDMVCEEVWGLIEGARNRQEELVAARYRAKTPEMV
jgi:hypothetical protein